MGQSRRVLESRQRNIVTKCNLRAGPGLSGLVLLFAKIPTEELRRKPFRLLSPLPQVLYVVHQFHLFQSTNEKHFRCVQQQNNKISL